MFQLWSLCSSEVLLVLLCLKVVIRTDLLHQPVVRAGEGDEDAYDLEGFGADPCCLGLRVFRVAGLPWIVHARLGLLGPVGSLVLDAAVELGHHHHVPLIFLMLSRSGAGGRRGNQIWEQDRVFIGAAVDRAIENLPAHCFGWRDDADGYVPQTGRVVPEVDAERSIDVVHDFSSHQEAELHGFHVEVEIPPAQDLLGLCGGFGRRLGFGRSAVQILVWSL